MNTKTKRRMVVATGVIIIVTIAVLAVVGGNSAARTVSVAEAVELSDDAKVQVTGNVAENSFEIDGDVLTFRIYDADADPSGARLLPVRYDGGVSATFGNDVTAICTGRKTSEGVLNCSELVTKCPSKYENATSALSVAGLLGYGDKVLNKPVIVAGAIGEGSLAGVGSDFRFTLVDRDSNAEVNVRFDGAMPESMVEGARIVATGSIGSDGAFTATNVAFEA